MAVRKKPEEGEKEVDLQLEARIKKEKLRISRIYKDVDKRQKMVIEGLIARAAFMRIQLEDLEIDIQEKGVTEMFQQGNQAPYERKRPKADLYNAMNTAYQKITKQLSDMVPKQAPVSKEDEFDEFVVGRDDK